MISITFDVKVERGYQRLFFFKKKKIYILLYSKVSPYDNNCSNDH